MNFSVVHEDIPTNPHIDFNFGEEVLIFYNLIAGTSNYTTSIVADVNASLSNGKFYVTSYGVGGAFTIIDLENKIVLDSYTTSIKGRAGEVLDQEDIIDLNIGGIN